MEPRSEVYKELVIEIRYNLLAHEFETIGKSRLMKIDSIQWRDLMEKLPYLVGGDEGKYRNLFLYFSRAYPIRMKLDIPYEEINKAIRDKEYSNVDNLPRRFDVELNCGPVEEIPLNIERKSFHVFEDISKIIESYIPSYDLEFISISDIHGDLFMLVLSLVLSRNITSIYPFVKNGRLVLGVEKLEKTNAVVINCGDYYSQRPTGLSKDNRSLDLEINIKKSYDTLCEKIIKYTSQNSRLQVFYLLGNHDQPLAKDNHIYSHVIIRTNDDLFLFHHGISSRRISEKLITTTFKHLKIYLSPVSDDMRDQILTNSDFEFISQNAHYRSQLRDAFATMITNLSEAIDFSNDDDEFLRIHFVLGHSIDYGKLAYDEKRSDVILKSIRKPIVETGDYKNLDRRAARAIYSYEQTLPRNIFCSIIPLDSTVNSSISDFIYKTIGRDFKNIDFPFVGGDTRSLSEFVLYLLIILAVIITILTIIMVLRMISSIGDLELLIL